MLTTKWKSMMMSVYEHFLCEKMIFISRTSAKNSKSQKTNFPIEQKNGDKMLSRNLPHRHLWPEKKFMNGFVFFPTIWFLKIAREMFLQEQHCDHHPCHVIVLSFWKKSKNISMLFLLSINLTKTKNGKQTTIFFRYFQQHETVLGYW